jgi:glycosyltransferase involved in cell wall biosynthesis
MMKVAFTALGDPRNPRYWSGTAFFICRELERAGCDVQVIAPLDRRFKYVYSGHKAFYKLRGLSFEIDRQPLALRLYARQIEKQLKQSDADIVFSTSSIPVSLLNCSQPIIYWTDAVFDGMVDYYAAFSNIAGVTARHGHLQEQAALQRATFAVYSSQWACDGAVRHYQVDARKVKLIPFGANLDVSHDSNMLRSMVKARRRDRCRLLFLGVDWERKGGPTALETARLLNEAGLATTLIVVGCNPFETSPKPNFVEQLNFMSKSNDDGRRRLTELLRDSHFLLLPTRAECSAIVYCEASAFGLPIVTTDTGGVATSVRNGVNGVRLPLCAEPAAYAATIHRLFADRSTYESMALAGFHEYQSRLNWRSGIAELIQLMRQAVETKNAPCSDVIGAA